MKQKLQTFIIKENVKPICSKYAVIYHLFTTHKLFNSCM